MSSPLSDPDDASPRLTWGEDGAPRSGRFGDVYFSTDDGLAESRAVFLEGCDLPNAWAGRSDFTVAELGFGTGLNIVALLDLWRRARPASGRLHVFTVEGFPLDREEAARALAAWPEVADAAQALLDAWPARTPGFHRIALPAFNAVIDLAVGDAARALDQWRGRADAWFLDGFSPALNPEMWSDAVLDGVAARSAPGARLATFTVAGAVRRGLAARGFTVDKRPGHGRKRERLEARMAGEYLPPPRPSVAIIGAGVAGASVARALMAGGASVTVIEADRPGAGGSGFPAGLVTPRFDAGDALVAGFNAQALERAVGLYRSTPGAVLAESVIRLEHGPRDAVRFEKIAAQPLWPQGALTPLDAAGAAASLGEASAPPGLSMSNAVAVRPASVLTDWLEGATVITGQAAAIAASDERHAVLDRDGAVLMEADVVVLAAGWGTTALRPDLPLTAVRGQADWVEGPSSPAVAWGGYAVPTPGGFLFGATHDRGDTGTDARAADTDRNLDQLRAVLPALAQNAERAQARSSRAAVRATTPDRMPLCGPVADGVMVLTGLGSRGFCHAPLLGEHLAAEILGLPSPLPRDFADRVSPFRGK